MDLITSAKLISKKTGTTGLIRNFVHRSRTLERFRLRRQYATLLHEYRSKRPIVLSVVVPDISPNSGDIAICRRLLEAYRQTRRFDADAHTQITDIWSEILQIQGQFIDVLNQNDPEHLARYLCNMSRHDATHGTVQGYAEYQRIAKSEEYRNLLSLATRDKLLAFAEAVGAIACENPEQGPWGANGLLSVDEIVQALERKIGIDLSPPPVDGGLLKVPSSKALFSDRDLQAQFTRWSIRELLGEGAAVCEIGGGVGRAAYWGHQFKCSQYIIVDLPRINVLQGFYLLKCLPEANIVLFGEDDNGKRPDIKILPYFSIGDIGPSSVDLVLNQDSFPEISSDVVRRYLEWIRIVSRSWLYSINQESRAPMLTPGKCQSNVPELIEEVGGYRRVSRTPYWLRKGYIAELYSVRSQILR